MGFFQKLMNLLNDVQCRSCGSFNVYKLVPTTADGAMYYCHDCQTEW